MQLAICSVLTNCQLFSKQFGVDKSKIAKVFVCCPSYDKAVSIGYKRTRAYQHQRSRFSTVIFSSAYTRSYVNFHDAHQDKTLTNICKRKMKCLSPSTNANCGCPTFIQRDKKCYRRLFIMTNFPSFSLSSKLRWEMGLEKEKGKN